MSEDRQRRIKWLLRAREKNPTFAHVFDKEIEEITKREQLESARSSNQRRATRRCGACGTGGHEVKDMILVCRECFQRHVRVE